MHSHDRIFAEASIDRDARRLKVTGLICLALGALTIGFPANRAETVGWLASAQPTDVALTVVMWFIGTNLLALGVVMLLAGLQDVPLLTSARARRGALCKIVGANLLSLCLAFAGLVDAPGTDRLFESWVAIPVLLLFIISAHRGVMLIRTGWKYEAISAERLLETDSRPPVVYVRSFRDDPEMIVTGSRTMKVVSMLLNYMTAFSIEQELAMFMSRVGPVVAIGRPGERIPELGAARLYVGDDEWQATIGNLMERARIVVIRAGSTNNLWWEIERAITVMPARPVILASLGNKARTDAFDKRFEDYYGRPAMAPDVKTDTGSLLVWLRRGVTFGFGMVSGRIIYFTENRKCYEKPIRFRISLGGLAFLGTRPYKDSLEASLKPVLAALDLPWARRRNQSTAVVLALFAGIVGAHHFYLGNRQKGFWYLAFATFGIPIFLGWIDGVQLALLNAREFEEQHLRIARDQSAKRSQTTCSGCGGRNDDAAKFCVQCGKSLPPAMRGRRDGGSGSAKTFVSGKNPIVALVLSLLIPGAGQFYNGDEKKGAAILGAYMLGVVLCLIAIGFIVVPGGVWIWGMIDAYNVASGKSPIW